ncbi:MULTISPECIES: alpha/beta family hydrolase [Ramlibacter]|uniref:Alpha/beta hydrolase n=1 Tax=Ramlibacter pinisoli TaxID=2682844 RepID=A0A6N8J0M9_9BURK|nr:MULTISPECIES: alpha/beta family hydrolase [Ramlibacter]MBA2962715.1 dienelactone hydrolase family protein [Ramlibacter sp. CGMCC 1.13660]MVQ32657.1 alpha/beta hydrolase [Ramlibacter pinisoli]
MTPAPLPLDVPLPGGDSLPGLLDGPAAARAGLVLGHGAGAGMAHPFLAQLAQGLAARGVAVLRYQFPFMARGSRRPDPPALAQAAVRAAVAEAARRWPGLALFAGGKSFGGRMASQAQAAEPLAGVRGLVFVGFPLHPARQPSIARAEHLQAVQVPMLFLQGTRDTLAELPLVTQVAQGLGERATLHVVDGADHGFEVLVRSGRTDAAVREELLETMAGWMLARAA